MWRNLPLRSKSKSFRWFRHFNLKTKDHFTECPPGYRLLHHHRPKQYDKATKINKHFSSSSSCPRDLGKLLAGKQYKIKQTQRIAGQEMLDWEVSNFN